MPERRDYLSVCNDQGVPLADFQATFCVRCVQPECSRSRAGGLFETRVATWEERLFKDPPRMSKDDALYAILAAKRFVEVDTGRTPEVHGSAEWLDPRTLVERPEPESRPRIVRAPRASTPSERAEESNPPLRAQQPTEWRAPLNTPFAQGTMLAGAPPVPPKPDRWAVATPPPAEESSPPTVVKAGAKIKFTGG
jgi:hypothetical protein